MDEESLRKRRATDLKAKRKKRYGLTQQEFDNLLQVQKGVCLICGKTNYNGWNLSVDHCHDTGKVRGLLCNPCNTGLGGFMDNPNLLANAIRYLKESETAKYDKKKHDYRSKDKKKIKIQFAFE